MPPISQASPGLLSRNTGILESKPRQKVHRDLDRKVKRVPCRIFILMTTYSSELVRKPQATNRAKAADPYPYPQLHVLAETQYLVGFLKKSHTGLSFKKNSFR
ncbi:uncharacterized protein AAGF69_012403 [Amazona ochrocephala]